MTKQHYGDRLALTTKLLTKHAREGHCRALIQQDDIDAVLVTMDAIRLLDGTLDADAPYDPLVVTEALYSDAVALVDAAATQWRSREVREAGIALVNAAFYAS